VRLIIDKNLDLPNNLNIFNNDAKTIVFNSIKSSDDDNIRYVRIDFQNMIQEILNECYVLNISSVIIEGGTKTINEFIQKNTWDEARLFVNSNKVFKQGIAAPVISFNQSAPTQIGDDLLYTITNL
jgi:diaminohydroxyphosphoribosylaminopyrimidine deaminase/5-amino-6-(5-phosphoribosylamino)uracil reductase